MMYPEKINSYLSSDAEFDALFPVPIRNLSGLHWTPLNVVQTAAEFLAPDASAHIIDIGAGVGKFCIAASLYSKGAFIGIEQKKNLVIAGNKVISQLGLQNVSLIHANFVSLDIIGYTGIYYYNSFHENLLPVDNMDNDDAKRSVALYDLYIAHFKCQLDAMPRGTRLATYWSSISEIPGHYKLKDIRCNDLLKLFIKT